jgi:HlyD family secretion protein
MGLAFAMHRQTGAEEVHMQNRHAVVFLLLLALMALVGCGSDPSSSESDAASSTAAFEEIADVVSATGEVRPARWADLGYPVGGKITTVHVEEGEEVAAGQLLVELDAVPLTRAVAEAQAALLAAEADLARVEAGPRSQDVAAAEEALAAAEANVGIAEAQVAAAEADSGRARAGVSSAQAQVAIALAGVKVAQAELGRVKAGAGPQEVAAALAGLNKARSAVRLAQAEYDRSGRASNSGEALALEQATLDVEIAQAEYDRLAAGPRASDLAPLEANVEAAEAQVGLAEAQVALAESQATQVEAAGAQTKAGLDAAQAQVGQARAALERVQAGTTAEEVAVAEAAVNRAQEAVTTAQANLDKAALTAPFDATVGLIHVRPGEEILPGQSVLVLGDLDTLRVETTDLDEIDVARVKPGQHADLTFDALAEEVLAGRVVRVAPMSTPGQAATSYAVIIEFEETHPALRWGMTAFADILVD